MIRRTSALALTLTSLAVPVPTDPPPAPVSVAEFVAFVRAGDTSGVTAWMTDEEVMVVWWPWWITRSIDGGVTG